MPSGPPISSEISDRLPQSHARSARRVRLCMKDLFHQDVVEMIERETRRYALWVVESPDDPDFAEGYRLLWEAFGARGEMEREAAIRNFISDNHEEPTPSGSYIRYFFIIAKDRDGQVRGVRDGSVLINPAYAHDLCVIYLSHIYMRPEARGTVLSYWLRICPVELAVQYLYRLWKQGKIKLPQPDAPGRYFGMKFNLAAEMDYFDPDDRISWQRTLFYGRGGFDAINPRHFPYMQPDFRDPEVILQTGNQPVPLMLLLRRMGRERQAKLPIEEAQAVMRLLYDDFACHCTPDFLANSLQLVLDRLAERARTKDHVELLPLPTGVRDLNRLKRFFRYDVFSRYYPNLPATQHYLAGGIRERIAAQPGYLQAALDAIAAELRTRPAYVYANRDQGYTWEGTPLVPSEPEEDTAAIGA